MSIDVRTAEVTDAADLMPLVLALGYDTTQAHLRRRIERLAGDSDHGLLVAADRPHGVVGFIHVSVAVSMLSAPRAEVRGLCVASERRREGIAKALLARAEQWALARGLDDVWILGEPHRSELAAFCKTVGYSPIEDGRAWGRKQASSQAPADPTNLD